MLILGGKMKLLFLFFLLLFVDMCFAKSTTTYEKYRHITSYDVYFQDYSRRFFGKEFDWKLFKSQAIAESNLNVYAKSSMGAEGLMQLMPKTFKEVAIKCDHVKGTAYNAQANIAAGIFYNKELYELWKTKKGEDRILFMLASYNAGKGNIIKAQRVALKKGEDPHKWDSIKHSLKDITGEKSKQTLSYVNRVKQIRREI